MQHGFVNQRQMSSRTNGVIHKYTCRRGHRILNTLANERIMDDNRNEPEPPLTGGSGNQVVEICVHHMPNRAYSNHEGAALNPGGGGGVNVASSFNLKTGKDDGRINELIYHMDKQKISIIGIQEHRRVHEDEQIKYQHIDNHLLITASAWRNTAQAAVGGVCLLLNAAAEKMLSDITWISERVIKATFAGKPRIYNQRSILTNK